MAAFVYYNPKTNTIERKFPTQPMSFQMPYLLNIQPQDINLAMRNTVDVRANPANFQQPSESFLPQFPPQEKVENFRLTKKVEKEMPKKSSLPPQRDHEENHNPNNPAPPSNNFLMMEDLREEDLNSIPDYYQAPAVEQPKARSSFKTQSFEPERALKKKPTFPDVQQNYAQEEARGDFKLVRHEDLMLKYKPEDYSINERILNAKYIREEQEKTKKFMLERMGNDLKAMEKAATMWEKDMEQTGKDTQDLEEKTKKIWEEVERKKFELKAQEIMNNVDRAVEIGHDLEQEDRIEQLLKENRALYAEIDKVLEDEGNPYEDGPTQYSLYTSPDTHKSSSSKTKGASVRRPGSSSQTRPAFDTSKSIVEQKFGRKNIVKTVSENKIKGATRVQMGSPGKKKSTTGKNTNTMFKNPKKVEEALQKAREIADLY